MFDLRAQVSARDTQIGILRASGIALEAKLVERSEDIILKDHDIVQITRDLRSVQQQKDEMEDRLNTLLKERETTRLAYDQTIFEFGKARSKIQELEKGISDRDQAIQSERSHFDEKISSQSQEIDKLKNNEKSLTTKATESKALAK